MDDEHRDYVDTIHTNIAKHGWHIVTVYDDEPDSRNDEPEFSYTIGNHERRLPELLMFGSERLSYILVELGEMMRARGTAFRHGELVSLGGKFPVKIVDTNPDGNYFAFHVGLYYGTADYRVQQVVICDHQGRFPGDPGCEEPYASFPVLALN
jgi:hypothetical protein